MDLSEAKSINLAVDDASVAEAEAEAAEAEQAAATLERAAVDGDKGAKPSAVIEARAVAEFARQRAGRMRQRADQAKAAARVLALGNVAEDVAAVARAAEPDAELAKAVRQIASGAAKLAELCGAHDQAVSDLMNRARDLGAEPPAPNGPRASSAHVTLTGSRIAGTGGIMAGRTTALLIGSSRVAEAAALAAEGKPEEAVARLNAVRRQSEFKRADHYFRAPNGRVIAIDEPLSGAIADQVRKRELRELTDAEADAYIDGRYDGHRPVS